ncbi:Mov34/MPN/PAD-1 family protein [Kribbella sp. NPDC050470]|uniref:Mov34/MPN/PAD-1 family protein n=1 Tax=unclassified Kribbella TaxID=2644121 RepID=UPI0037AB419F
MRVTMTGNPDAFPTLAPESNSAPEVSITATALNVIAREARQSRDGLETGGILLGHDFGQRVEIRHAGDAGPDARRGTHTFDRDLAHATALAEAAWTHDRSQWLGEWHTHPNQEPVPSPRDLTSYLQHLNDPELDFTQFISIIVTEHEGTISAVTWLVDSTHATPISLRRQP